MGPGGSKDGRFTDRCRTIKRLERQVVAAAILEALMGDDREYVRSDESGVYRIGTTRVMLDSIVAAFREGHSAETIQQQYPALTLEEVYGSIAWCLAHTAEVKVYLQRQESVWENWRARSEEFPSAVVERLRALTKADTSEPR
jgi:uncharacterized protein (DUF433 family)